MKRKFIFLVVIISVIISCVGCGSSKAKSSNEATKSSDATVNLQEKDTEIENLSQQVADLKVSVKDLQDIISGTTKKGSTSDVQKETNIEGGSYEQYVNMKFPKTDGKTYSIRKDNKVKFYADVYCAKEITDIPDFVSKNADNGTAPNGLSIYAFRTVNDEIIYTTQKPIIVEVEN